MSHAAAWQRDDMRLADLMPRVATLPLGSGALAGNPFLVDRQFIAQELGMVGGVCPNSMDAVSDREWGVGVGAVQWGWGKGVCRAADRGERFNHSSRVLGERGRKSMDAVSDREWGVCEGEGCSLMRVEEGGVRGSGIGGERGGEGFKQSSGVLGEKGRKSMGSWQWCL